MGKKKPKFDASTPEAAHQATQTGLMNVNSPISDPQSQQLVNLNVDLDKDDVIMVGIARAETVIQDHIVEERRVHSDAEKNVARLNDEIAKAIKLLAEQSFADQSRQLLTEVAAMGVTKPEVKRNYSHDPISRGKDDKPEKPTVTLTLTVTGMQDDKKGNTTSVTCQRRQQVKLPPDIVALQKERDASLAEQSRAEKAALEWKRKLGQMPQLERQFRARVAEQRLRTHAGGDAMLQALLGSVEQDVLKLARV